MDITATTLALFATIGFSIVVPIVASSTKRIGAIPTLFLLQAMGIPFFLFLTPIMPALPSETHIFSILLIGVVFTFIYLLFLHAMKLGTVSIIGTVNQLYVVVVATLGILLLGESISLWKAVGMVLTICGVALLSLQRQKKLDSVKLLGGVPFALLSALGTGFYLFAITITSRSDGWFLTALFIRIAIAMTTICILIYRNYNFSQLPTKAPWKLLLTAAICDVGAFSLFNYCISRFEVSNITIVTASQAAFIALLSWKFLGEKLSRQQIVGIIVVVCGLVSVQIQ